MISPGVPARDVVTVIGSGLFDGSWYLDEHPDVRSAGSDPLVHFLTQGWREGRSPGPYFDLAWYRTAYASECDADTNPLVHYLTAGWRLDLRPLPTFDPVSYRASHPEAAHLDVAPIVHQVAMRPVSDATTAEGSPHDLSVPRGPRVGTWSPEDLSSRAVRPAVAAPVSLPLQVIAHYLPQFHRIPENDAWWGEGFTEWTNVRRGVPRYPGHSQPHVPVGEGYYDLGDPAVLRRQAQTARLHGVTAFAMYSYWFEGRQLLHQPLLQLEADRTIDIGYCVVWANESWTRTWSGRDGEVLISQTHAPDDDLAFIAAHARYLRDPRYVRVDGRPVLCVYRAEDLPDPRETAARWRDWCRVSGIGDIHLVAVQAEGTVDPREIGFDAAMEFWPNAGHLTDITAQTAGPEYPGRVYDWTEFVSRSTHYTRPTYPLYRGVCVGWDSEARRPGWGTSLHGATPDLFRQWLSNAASDTMNRFEDPTQRIVFVNAWNEWAEGCHLEPDEQVGFQWLHAIRDVQVSLGGGSDRGHGPEESVAGANGVVVVSHDMHPHGAQFGAVALARTLREMRVPVEAVTLGPGRLESQFRELTRLHVVPDDAARHEIAAGLAADLRRRGFTTALVNSIAGEWFGRHARDAGLHVVTFVHEMPDLLVRHALTESAARASDSSDSLVFASPDVLRMFPGAGDLDPAKVKVLPQGLYRRELLTLPLHEQMEGKRLVGVPIERPLVLGVGYGDHRKGFDRFVASAEASLDTAPMHFVWIGNIDHHDDRMGEVLARARELANLSVVGFVDDLSRWYAAADVLFLASREDPFPSVVLEAAACGIGTVAFSTATGMAALIDDLGGRLIDSDDPAAMLAALTEQVAADIDRGRMVREHRRDAISRTFSHRSYVLDVLSGTPAALPRVSAAVPSYQHARFLGERLESIVAQDFPVYEVVVIDDASDDDSSEVARRALQGADVSWRVIVNGENSGSVWLQWAACARVTSGEMLWIAESDDGADPSFLRVLIAGLQRSGSVAAFCQARPVDQEGRTLGPDYRDYLERFVPDVAWGRSATVPGETFRRDWATVLNPILTVSSLVSAREHFGGALTDMSPVLVHRPTTGDWLVYTALARRGSIDYHPEALCRHRRHDASVIGSADPSEHLNEVSTTQGELLDAVEADEHIRARAATYLAAMSDQIGVGAA